MVFDAGCLLVSAAGGLLDCLREAVAAFLLQVESKGQLEGIATLPNFLEDGADGGCLGPKPLKGRLALQEVILIERSSHSVGNERESCFRE